MRPRALELLICLSISGVAARAYAKGARRYFEPTDLEMERPGVLDVDLQVGMLRESADFRASAPDFEIDLGLAPSVELDVDGACHVELPGQGDSGKPRAAFDDLWIAAKLGLYDSRVAGSSRAWALGLQLGPKLPLAEGAQGAGYEALLLLAETGTWGQVVVNAGGFVDPGAELGGPRPHAFEGGVDVAVDAGVAGVTITGELGGVRFFSSDDDQLHATAGVSWAASDALDLSLVVLAGLLRTGERGGVLLGISPKLPLFR